MVLAPLCYCCYLLRVDIDKEQEPFLFFTFYQVKTLLRYPFVH